MRAGVSVVVTAGRRSISLYLSTSPPEGHCGGWERDLGYYGWVFGSLFFGPLFWCEGQTEHLLSRREGLSPVCRRMECFGSRTTTDQTKPILNTYLGYLNIIWAPELFWADTFGIVVGQH
jgi:hypothetical protein